MWLPSWQRAAAKIGAMPKLQHALAHIGAMKSNASAAEVLPESGKKCLYITRSIAPMPSTNGIVCPAESM
jgi:hypothetical protein